MEQLNGFVLLKNPRDFYNEYGYNDSLTLPQKYPCYSIKSDSDGMLYIYMDVLEKMKSNLKKSQGRKIQSIHQYPSGCWININGATYAVSNATYSLLHKNPKIMDKNVILHFDDYRSIYDVEIVD